MIHFYYYIWPFKFEKRKDSYFNRELAQKTCNWNFSTVTTEISFVKQERDTTRSNDYDRSG